ncbi:MAG: inositol monophosphatase [Chloroflexi bacterium]|nr:inositol monophosphatase [Chloroflexota bacterium]MCL5275888.1 inositol monophosphatase [Chloroflexota bacterium]
MDLDTFWEHVFSEDATQVRLAWQSLDPDEREAVRKLLNQIVADPERIEAQRTAARFALGIIAGLSLPEGALEFARELAHRTGERLKHASGGLIASTKQDGTLVTASDIETDQRMGDAIKASYPDHGVLSEEGVKVYGGEEWCWIIDPIDGTTNFMWGYPGWGVLVGLLHYGQPVLGVAEFPPFGLQFYAVSGQGAWRSSAAGDEPIHASTERALTSTQLFVIGTRSQRQGLLKLPCKLRLPGSSGFDFALLASGACVGVYDSTVHVWDIAALWSLLEESGAQVVTDRPGGVFPLQAGVDYSSVEFAVVGAGTSELLAESLALLSDRFAAA